MPTDIAIAVVEQHGQFLIGQRPADVALGGLWEFPGGKVEPGELPVNAAIRECLEETGLVVRISKLIGVYSTPHRIILYADGNRFQIISMSFEAQIVGGAMTLSDETSAIAYFSVAEIQTLDIMEHHVERIHDALRNDEKTIVA